MSVLGWFACWFACGYSEITLKKCFPSSGYKTSQLWIQGRVGVQSVRTYQGRLLWWSVQRSGCENRLSVCCQKGNAAGLSFPKFCFWHEGKRFSLITLCFLSFCGQIPLKRFSSEEVGAWSTLRSPRVVELFGVVRDGPDVFLLMDLKFGKWDAASQSWCWKDLMQLRTSCFALFSHPDLKSAFYVYIPIPNLKMWLMIL